MNIIEIEKLNTAFIGKSPMEVIKYATETFGNKIALSSSLGAEDQALTHMLMNVSPETRIFTLDTGRLFPEAYDLLSRTSKKYKKKIEVFFPDKDDVETMVNLKGVNLFYDSVQNRKLCCHVRKIEPLKRAFNGLEAWICGLRAQQSVTRNEAQLFEWDKINGLVKINPLVHWDEDTMWAYIKENNVPYNKMHDNGFPSIGCQPCTRAISETEDVRAGRWWWENPETKECGLHKR